MMKEWLDSLETLSGKAYNGDFLLTWDHSLEEIRGVLTMARLLKELHRCGRSFRVFETGLAVSVFRDNSTRTRFSFASAVNALGLGLSELDEVKSQIAHGETVRETATMISFLAQVIGIRDDMYLGEGHRYMGEVAAALQEGYEQGVLHQRPAVINLQCDIDHPTQTLADLAHLEQYFGSLENLRGKKIAMSWAYSPSYGKPLSVPQGIIGLMSRLGMHVVLASPEGYGLLPDVVRLAEQQSQASGGSLEIVETMGEAFQDADIIYPKSWAPFQVMERRTQLLKQKDQEGLHSLEKECLANNARHLNWECNESVLAQTRNGNALYMHCLPADITDVSCRRGEVSAAVFERYRLDTYRQASYKPFIIAALILLTRFARPADVLRRFAA